MKGEKSSYGKFEEGRFWRNRICACRVYHVNCTDYIVGGLLEYGKSCELVLPEDFEELFIGAFYVSKGYVYTGHHDILGSGIPKIKHIIYHLFFV